MIDMTDLKKSLPYIALTGIVYLIIRQFGTTNRMLAYQMPSEPRLIFFPIVIFTMMAFVIHILIAVWVYNDAQRRGEEAVVWLLIVLFTNLIGLIIYLIVRGESRRSRPAEYQQAFTGQPAPSGTIYCNQCGSPNTRGAGYCNDCGAQLTR